MTRLVLGLLLFLPLQAMAEVSVRADPPRGYGWWLGDRMTQRIIVSHPADLSIERSSLPRPRSAEYWLDLVSVRTRDLSDGTEIILEWQNFYSALEPSLREVPGATIRMSDGTEVTLPGFGFVTAPIRPILAPSTPDQLQPDPGFPLVDPQFNRAGLAVSACLFLVALVELARNQAWWPFHARPARPLTRAARQIAAQRKGTSAGLRELLHRGLDRAFGEVLIGPDLDRFLAARPEFAPARVQLAEFFQASDDAFFGSGTRQDDPNSIIALARKLSAIERGRR
ncbi:nonribosomal peptide synthetase MxaA [Roseovarius atlanticus]|uniref:nonribosomal peptide synthetase MxaA n=1 Tax=Roseovarius atlanticus TaxID=1641875 RepID=UPI0028F73D5E|nr:nonribosomal peptide synthetase MxaA [Roseovarius atlanticus]